MKETYALFKHTLAFAKPCAFFKPIFSLNSHKFSAVSTASVNILSKSVVSFNQLSLLMYSLANEGKLSVVYRGKYRQATMGSLIKISRLKIINLKQVRANRKVNLLFKAVLVND
ncbi:hypothetical protein [Colwellia sp. Arc7-635]|uniref:hypothetical protein n=1 Tax=Colwellia sp. Arc7-635 TaxID=2497879 RepID=UPI0013DED500|nr:hypothetical protein [Colwellia sp. Arc7-635]